jgi:hypothetical protein
MNPIKSPFWYLLQKEIQARKELFLKNKTR